MAEEIDTRFASAIIEAALNQHSKHSALASIDVAYNSNSCLNDFVYVLRAMSYNHLAAEARIFYVSRTNLDVASNIPGHQNLVVGLDQLAHSLHSPESEVPILFGKPHTLAVVLEPKIKQDLAMPLSQALLDVLTQRGYILFGRINEQCLQSNVRFCVVAKTELIEDAQLIVVL